MGKFAASLQSFATTLWIGGMWAIGYMVAPILFATLPDDRMLAGALAGKMFGLIAWVGIACSAYLMVYHIASRGSAGLRRSYFWIVLVMLLLILAGHFGVQPVLAHLKLQALPHDVMQSIVRDRFSAWHGISSILYVIQSVLGLVLVVRRVD
jgi:hypothetical protein